MPLRITIFTLLAFLAVTATIPLRAQTPAWGWATSIGGVGSENPQTIATDGTGNLYISGRLGGIVQLGSFHLGFPDSITQFVASWSPGGTLRWARAAVTGAHIVFGGMSVDANGDVYVTAAFKGSSAHIDRGGSDTTIAGAPGTTMMVFKYDSTGTLVWERSANGSGANIVNGISVAPQGIWIAGSFSESVDAWGTTLVSSGSSDLFLAMLDRNGTAMHVMRAGGTGTDLVDAVAADRTGNAVLLGRFSGTADFGSRQLAAQGPSDFFLADFTPDGTATWVRQDGGTSFSPIGMQLAVAPSGVIYVGITYFDRVTVGSTTFPVADEADALLVQYDAGGAPVWTFPVSGGFIQELTGLAADAAGNVYAAGFSQGGLPTGDMFVMKVAPAGSRTWLASNAAGDGMYSSQGGPVCVDGRQNVYVSGSFSGSERFGATQLTSVGSTPTSTNGTDIFLARLNSTSGVEMNGTGGTQTVKAAVAERDGWLDISIPGLDPAPLEAELYTMRGNRVAATASFTSGGGSNTGRIAASGLARGAYLLVLHTASGIASQTVFIQR
ncbi:MAG TPA: hypothetical protein VHI13_17490 [Candidatus Kapabacteria bacterium]|nr:hypothetical protein [Candidatus Kapabacteria bacterium]